MNDTDDCIRVDVWLWRSRFFKVRSDATAHVKKRGVRITRGEETRRTKKAAAKIFPGDVVTFTRGKHINCIRMISAGTRRGPAEEAQGLYDVVEAEDV